MRPPTASFVAATRLRVSFLLLCAFISALTVPAPAAVPALPSLVQQEKAPLIATLKELVEIESGSRDLEGLARIAAVISTRLRELGGTVELIAPPEAEIYRMHDTPEQTGRVVKATFTGTGTRRILLLAHMDTVYPRGMLARQPFRIDGNRIYGLGIADDKQGIALILHTVALLKKLGFAGFGTLTVLINADEEIGSPGSRELITRLGAEHDAVFSFEFPRIDSDSIMIATSGIAAATLTVRGRGAHAGMAPELGVNALYELAHQILQTRDLSQPERGLKFNWTLAQAGVVRNMIPPEAVATADVRVLSVADYDQIERRLRDGIRRQLIPEATVELTFERRRPPLEPTPASRELARRAQEVYREIGRELAIVDRAEGGGTDAAFAALRAKGPVIENFGLPGFGAHSVDAEYVRMDAIEPRLYLATRMLMVASE
jgi:glutamate carboxypeptidase